LQVENVEFQGSLHRVFGPVPSQILTSSLRPKSLGQAYWRGSEEQRENPHRRQSLRTFIGEQAAMSNSCPVIVPLASVAVFGAHS
jgi:hypothetical protein